ncbi:ATP-NAD kinase-like domain-containing protein [Phycomyces nitens]|nr:ATP-NAD kinase-like domain-containing protein [Phycomyces nitens]
MVNPPSDGNGKQSAMDLARSHQSNNILQVPGSTYGGHFSLDWTNKAQNVLIVKKSNDLKSENALIEIATWLHEHSNVNIIVEPEVAEQFHKKLPFVHVIAKDQKQEYSRTVDFAITLGGDGTMLHLSSLFPKAVPPVVCFSLGTLGFLMSFQFNQYKRILSDVMEGKVFLTLRMRLFCSLHEPSGKRISVDGKEVEDRQVMNEVSLHRGRYPHLTSIGCYVDDSFLTECVADGLIVATPTGSTAYSLSAGGPIVHPSVQSIVLTPICPRSLSFRTVLLPPSANIHMKIGESSRSQIEVSIDGQEIFMLEKGEYVQVRMSKYPIPCVSRTGEGNDWAKDINELLKWNQNFGRSLS